MFSPLRLLEGEVIELDLQLALIGDRGVRGKERAVRPGGAWTARPFQEPGTVRAAARVAIWVRDA